MTPVPPLLVSFVGGGSGPWRVERMTVSRGDDLPPVRAVSVIEGRRIVAEQDVAWTLRGVASHERYVTRAEHEALAARQPSLGRPEATRAALIPIRKSPEWWALAQDERRHIIEERSHHVAVGLEYLPAIARRLHHARDLGEPFDFLTWFEYAPEHAERFEGLVARLRATEEWRYVDREIDI